MRPRSSGSVKVFYPPWSREALLVRLREGVTALREVLPLVRVVLFGSSAPSGENGSDSDIDLLVVYAGAVRADAYALVRRALDLRRLKATVYAEEEYTQVSATLERMLQDGITVYSASVDEDCQPAVLD